MITGVVRETSAGQPVRYFHGWPGSAQESRLAGLLPSPRTEATHLVGFSLGAMHAIAYAASRPEAVRTLTLISPTAPLQADEHAGWLGEMEGCGVFKAARDHPRLFRGLCAVQGGLARLAPGVLQSVMFAEAAPAERELVTSPGVRPLLLAGLRSGFGRDYQKTIRAYLRDWRGLPARVRADTQVIMGSDDRWTPPAMGLWLASEMGARTVTLDGAGHYGALAAARDLIPE